MSGTDIFLSYARQDRGTARIFAECLGEEGFHVWWDASLRSGETFDEVIEQRLRDAKAVIVLWSPRSVASRWVRAEATLADRRDKLAPAIIEPCDLPIIFELKHAAELVDWAGDTSDLRWRRFVHDLRRLVEAKSDPEIGASHRPAAKRPSAANVTEDQSMPAPAMSRRPLRPGSDEVIYADTRRGPLRDAAEDDANSEVHCLELKDGDLGDELFIVDSSRVKIGRTAPADIVLSHKSVSREHCVIGLANDELLVTDLSSTNGTYIDGERVSRATILPVGSVLRLGQVSLTHTVQPRADASPNETGRRLEKGRLAAAP